MVIKFLMWRNNLITKEKMENYCKGKEEWDRTDSINDDLESLIEDIRLGKKLDDSKFLYFLPKLTKEELKLVATKDSTYLESFSSTDPDVDEAEMKASESDSKFVLGRCIRRAFIVENTL